VAGDEKVTNLEDMSAAGHVRCTREFLSLIE
jgi:hypothetical protein